jgi:3-phenylpropionate/cinnamic acid dioxygenase small subunit
MDSERLRRLEDRQAVQELLVSYARSCDDRDWPRYRSLFTPDAEIDYTAAYGRRGQRDDIADWIEELMSAPALQHTQHMLSNFEIALNGDCASGRADYLNPDVFARPGRRELLVNGGIYDFTAMRTDTGWRLSTLTARILWSAKGRVVEKPLPTKKL